MDKLSITKREKFRDAEKYCFGLIFECSALCVLSYSHFHSDKRIGNKKQPSLGC